jgi:hypothetical protein
MKKCDRCTSEASDVETFSVEGHRETLYGEGSFLRKMVFWYSIDLCPKHQNEVFGEVGKLVGQRRRKAAESTTD